MKFWLAVYTAICAVGLLIVTHSLTRANEVEVGSGLLCDTQQQVEIYLKNDNPDPAEGVAEVNREVNDPVACVLISVAFIRGEQGAVIRTSTGAWRVTPVLVVAVYLPHGWQQIAPHKYFTALKVSERST